MPLWSCIAYNAPIIAQFENFRALTCIFWRLRRLHYLKIPPRFIRKPEWLGSHECHVANAGDWLVVWRADNKLAVFQRTGSHDDIFK